VSPWEVLPTVKVRPPAGTTQAFTAIGRIRSWSADWEDEGSCFLVNPWCAVTAGHLVAHRSYERKVPAGRLDLHFGAALSSAHDKELPVPDKKKVQETEERVRTVLWLARELSDTAAAAVAGDFASVWQTVMRHARPQTDGKPDRARLCPAALSLPESMLTRERMCIDVPNALVRYGGLMVAIATARDSDEVKKAVLAAAEPVGAWRLKYSRRWMLSIDGMLGVGMNLRCVGGSCESTPTSEPGVESSGSTTPYWERYTSTRPVVLPLGIDLNLLYPWNRLSIGLFAQVLDLSGFLQLGGDKPRAPRLSQALSPGVFARVGLFGSPAVLLAGIAYDVDDGIDEKPRGGWRPAISLGVTTTLFMLKRQPGERCPTAPEARPRRPVRSRESPPAHPRRPLPAAASFVFAPLPLGHGPEREGSATGSAAPATRSGSARDPLCRRPRGPWPTPRRCSCSAPQRLVQPPRGARAASARCPVLIESVVCGHVRARGRRAPHARPR